MGERTGERPVFGVGRAATTAAIAGLAGVAITVVAVATLLIGTVFGAGSPGLVPGYEDYGQRHRADYAPSFHGAPNRLDDYGIRCEVVGWCAMPPGVSQPARSAATD